MRLVKRALGWVAGFFPNHAFYGNRFMERLDGEENDGRILIGLCVSAARRGIEPGHQLEGIFTGVTDRGKEIGDYTVTVRRDA